MASTRRESSAGTKKTRRPLATTPEGRENQLISQAVDLVEKQIQDGTVSSQVLSHYVKLGSTRERLEQQRLMKEVELMERKAEMMDSAKRIEQLYDKAIQAMRSYGGEAPEPEGEEY